VELAGTAGLDEGRYLARDPERVLVIRIAGAPAAPRRRLRKAKPTEAAPASETSVPITRLTAVDPQPIGDEAEARRWLATLRDDAEMLEAKVDEAVRLMNEAIHAQRGATLDPALPDVSAAHALAVRVGYGDGERLADGKWEEAIELPGAERRRRLEALAPQERIAAVFGGRADADAATGSLLRARADLDAGRERDAALQLRIGLEAMLADGATFGGRGQADDLAALEERKRITGEAANEALAGPLSSERTNEVDETLKLCERVLRRRRAYGG
jgi:hypothetical protein